MLSKDSIIELADYLNTTVQVQIGEKLVTGKLKSYDKIPNLVLEDAVENSYGDRELGIVIIRGQMISYIAPGTATRIENPFK